MIEEREVITLFLGLFAAVLAFQNRRSLVHLPSVRLLLASAALLLCGSLVSILEGLFFEDTFNALEHVAYGLCSFFLAVWVGLSFTRRRAPRDPEI